MPRLSTEEITAIKLMTLRGDSLNRISRDLHLPKSSVYYHFKKLRGVTYAPPSITPQGTRIEGEICGIFAGDGSQNLAKTSYGYDTNIHFGRDAHDYAAYVKNIFETFFGKRWNLMQSDVALRLRTRSKDVFNYFSNYLDYDPHAKHCSVSLKDGISTEFKIGFLKGFLDTDGAVLKDKDIYLRIIYTTTSRRLAHQLANLLREFDIDSSIQLTVGKNKPLYRVRVSSRQASKFLMLTSPWKGRAFLNGSMFADVMGS